LTLYLFWFITETNISGRANADAGLMKNMVLTPPSTLVKGVERLLLEDDGEALNGEVLEIHGDSVTLRPPHEVVDEDSRHNLEEFMRFGGIERA
jgi:hypothetical protein